MTNAIKRRGLLFVLSSPSGAGKTTISRRLLADDNDISLSVSATTRQPRDGEVDGKDYFFVSTVKFDNMISDNKFLEYAEVFGNYYGTPTEFVMQALEEGRDVLFDIDWQGGQALMETLADDLVKVFILPPSIAELEKRLRGRASDSNEVVVSRMEKSADEMSHYAGYDWVIVNEDLEISINQVQSILQSERLKRTRQEGLISFVANLRKGY